jgi:hypothetical protein
MVMSSGLFSRVRRQDNWLSLRCGCRRTMGLMWWTRCGEYTGHWAWLCLVEGHYVTYHYDQLASEISGPSCFSFPGRERGGN